MISKIISGLLSIRARMVVSKANYDFFPDSVGCGRLNTRLTNKSIGDDNFSWSFGDGRTSTQRSPMVYYPSVGTFPVKLIVSNDALGCTDSLVIPFVVLPLPEVVAIGDTVICLGDTAEIEALSGMDSQAFLWQPSHFALDPDSARTKVVPDETTNMVVATTDSMGCVGKDSVRVTVQDIPELTMVVDTTVAIGEEFKLHPSTPDSLVYKWSPPHAFDCFTCKNPWFKAELSDWYSVTVRDIYGCFEKEFEFRVEVEEKFSVDLPNLFSPNGDGVNDQVFVRGWGIKSLEEFRIYNRWGQEVYFGNDLKQGWDGTYRGADQQVDTYAYLVKVVYYDETEKTISGFIELIR